VALSHMYVSIPLGRGGVGKGSGLPQHQDWRSVSIPLGRGGVGKMTGKMRMIGTSRSQSPWGGAGSGRTSFHLPKKIRMMLVGFKAPSAREPGSAVDNSVFSANDRGLVLLSNARQGVSE